MKCSYLVWIQELFSLQFPSPSWSFHPTYVHSFVFSNRIQYTGYVVEESIFSLSRRNFICGYKWSTELLEGLQKQTLVWASRNKSLKCPWMPSPSEGKFFGSKSFNLEHAFLMEWYHLQRGKKWVLWKWSEINRIL